ncbi:MAG: VanZ family protein [Desulfocapsaceae bacterium]
MKRGDLSPKTGAAAGYLLCFLLIPIYVNMFPIWKHLSSQFGEDIFIYLPLLFLVLFIGCTLGVWVKAGIKTAPINKVSLSLGILFCCLGLLTTDPEFPVKRVHVVEYAFLCLVARYAMSHFLQGLPLFFFSAFFCVLLGVHDEFLQGLHPARTYGLRDMGVNLLGSFGGGLIWHSLHLFSKRQSSAIRITDICFVCWLAVSVLMLVWPAQYYRGLVLEMWISLPLLVTGVYYYFYRNKFTTELSHGITSLALTAVVLGIYPLATRMPGIVFY